MKEGGDSILLVLAEAGRRERTGQGAGGAWRFPGDRSALNTAGTPGCCFSKSSVAASLLLLVLLYGDLDHDMISLIGAGRCFI